MKKKEQHYLVPSEYLKRRDGTCFGIQDTFLSLHRNNVVIYKPVAEASTLFFPRTGVGASQKWRELPEGLEAKSTALAPVEGDMPSL